MHSKTRTLAAAAIGAALIGTSLTACSAGGSGAGGVTTINWWTRVGDDRAAFAKDFNKSHKNLQVKVTQVPDDQYVNKIGTGVRSSNGPDAIDFDVANGPLFAASGVLADISDKAKSLDFTSSLNTGMVKLGKYGDKTYSLPFQAGPSILLYNKTLYAKAGLPDRAPSTWAEIKADAQKIRALGGKTYGFDIPGSCGGCLSFTAQPLIWADGGQTMTAASKNQTTTYASNPQVADAFNFYRDLWKAGVVNPAGQTEAGATWGQDFDAGKVGIILAGAWLIAPAEKAGYKIGYGPIPGKSGGYATFAGGDNVGITSSSKKQDAAWTFTQWLLSKSTQTKVAKNGNAPIRSDLLTPEFEKTYPIVSLQVKVGDKADAPDSIATNALQLSASSPWLKAFQSVVYDGADAATALKAADTASQPLIKQAYDQIAQ